MNEVIQKVIETVQKELPHTKVQLQNVPKNNGVILQGLTIFDNRSRIAPTIYLDDMIQDGLDARQIAAYVLSTYRSTYIPDECDTVSNITNYGFIKNHLTLYLINKERNQELFKIIPYKEFLDLAVIAVILLDEFQDGAATIKVNNNLLDIWDISFEEVMKQAYKNFTKEKTTIINVMDLLEEYGYVDSKEIYLPMYVMTNESKVNGASRLLNEQELSRFANTCDMDVAVIPSSIHETILVPMLEGLELSDLTRMVKEVNLIEVSQEEQLSDHAYIYRLNGGWSDYTNK